MATCPGNGVMATTRESSRTAHLRDTPLQIMEVVTKSDDTLSRPERPGPGNGALMEELKPQHINGYFLKVYE